MWQWTFVCPALWLGVVLLPAAGHLDQEERRRGVSEKAQDASKDWALVGSASCSARACHGSIDPNDKSRSADDKKRIRRDEFTTWVRTDKHAAAYRVLFGDAARRILKNLSSPADGRRAHEDDRCLGCHTLPGASAREDLAWMWPDGVGCEACHGPAGKWLKPHTAPEEWRERIATEGHQGMTPVDDLAAVALTCAGCHVGSPPDAKQGIPLRDVSHDLIAAGHPRLSFEFTTFLAHLPPHWDRTGRSKRPEPAYSIRAWTTGQLASAEAALKLLAYRADAMSNDSVPRNNTWPEFAEYDCYSCHHALREPSWRQAPPGAAGRALGRWKWGSWYFPLLAVIPDGQPGNHEVTTDLRKLMEQPRPDLKVVAAEAQRVGGLLQKWQSRLTEQPPAAGMLRDLADKLSREGLAAPPSWDLAEQVVLAASVFENAHLASRGGPVPTGNRRQTQAAIQAMLRDLAFRQGMDSPDTFKWDESFNGRLRELLKRLCRE
jgi:hypothetical protein